MQENANNQGTNANNQGTNANDNPGPKTWYERRYERKFTGLWGKYESKCEDPLGFDEKYGWWE